MENITVKIIKKIEEQMEECEKYGEPVAWAYLSEVLNFIKDLTEDSNHD